jgi:molybdate transport system substrate-binding protein
MKYLLSSLVILTLALGIAPTAHAQNQITLLAPAPIRGPLDKLLAAFETKTGTHVMVTYGGGVPTRKQVASGKGLDVDLLFAPFPEVLQTGNVVTGSATVVAQVRLALAVKKGATKPDISTAAAVKTTLLNAKSIASVDPAQGSVGGIAQAVLDKLSIGDQVKPKFQWIKDGNIVQDLVAKGEVEIALGPYLSDMNKPGIDVVGPLPVDVSTPVDITGFLSSSLQDTKSAKSLLDYLKSKGAASIWEQARIFPVQ